MESVLEEFDNLQELYWNKSRAKASWTELELISKKANILFLELFYQKKLKIPFFWRYCSFKCYSETYTKRLKSFLKKGPDYEELDFIKQEYFDLYSFEELRDRDSMRLEGEAAELERTANYKKKEYFKKKLLALNLVVQESTEIVDGEIEEIIEFIPKSEIVKVPEITDVSINKKTPQFDTITIVYFFKKFGLIDKMYDYGYTKGNIYEMISQLTGRNQQNIKTQHLKIDKLTNDHLIESINQKRTKDSITAIDELFNNISGL